MFKITIDENEYERDSLTAENKVELKHMVTSVTKIVELQRDLAIVQTVSDGYAIAIEELQLEKNNQSICWRALFKANLALKALNSQIS